MSIQQLLIGEMLRLLREWQAHKAAFEAYVLTAVFLAEIERVAGLLVKAEDAVNKPGRPPLKAADDNVDTPLRRVSRALDWLEDAFPEESALWARIRQLLFPAGLKALVASSYRNEVGELERMEHRLAANAALRQELAGVQMYKRTLLSFIEEAIAAAKVLGGLLDQPAPAAPPPEVNEREARSEFVTLIGAVRRAADLAKWSDEHRKVVFGVLDATLADAAKRAAKPAPQPG